MTLQETIKADMIKSMKAKNTDLTMLLRLATSEMTRENKIVSDEDAIKSLRKMVKDAKEMKNEFEVTELSKYLPQMLSEDMIRNIVVDTIRTNNFTGMQDMGKVMGAISKHPDSNLIDGKISSKIVRDILS